MTRDGLEETPRGKIAILSAFQVINNPRVFKEASVLADAGYEVTVFASLYDESSRLLTQRLIASSKFKVRYVLDATGGVLDRVRFGFWRLLGKMSRVIHAQTGLETPLLLGNAVYALKAMAVKGDYDLYICHLEQSLYVGSQLISVDRRVAIDMEDWYSRDCLPEDQKKRPLGLLEKFESKLLRECALSYTTSDSLATALARHFKCAKPAVLSNSFLFSERSEHDGELVDRKDRRSISVTWFSQTIGPGRGLELLLSALSQVESDWELHVRGTPRKGYQEELLACSDKGLQARVFFHPQVPQEQLLSRLMEHDIGFCGELSDVPSRDMTITNKALEYLRAGLAVVATDTQGHIEVASKSNGFHIFKQDQPESLVSVLETLLSVPEVLAQSKQSNLELAQSDYCWERESAKLISLVDECLQKT